MTDPAATAGPDTGSMVTDAAAELTGALADEGVQHLFINPGTDTAPVQEALAAARKTGTRHPRAILCTHEFVALSSAMGHYFATGTPQAVMVHVDAGTLNLGGALHNAQRNRVPAVIFAGRTPYSSSPDVPGHRDTAIHWQQEQLDQQAVVRAFGKWTMEVPRGRELGGIVRRAYQVAQTDPRGLAYVTLPREALMEPGGTALARRLAPPRPAAPAGASTASGHTPRRPAGSGRPRAPSGRTDIPSRRSGRRTSIRCPSAPRSRRPAPVPMPAPPSAPGCRARAWFRPPPRPRRPRRRANRASRSTRRTAPSREGCRRPASDRRNA